MGDYWAVKGKIIEVVGWFTRDEKFAQRYLQKYKAATRLDDPNLGITTLALGLMAHPLNDEVGPLVPGWTNLGTIDLANCGADTVGEFIEFVCQWAGIAPPDGEPT